MSRIIIGKNVFVMYPSRWDRLKCITSGVILWFFWFKVNSFLTNHHNSRAYAILFTWIKVITLFDYCGIDIQPVKFGTPNAPQFDIDPYILSEIKFYYYYYYYLLVFIIIFVLCIYRCVINWQQLCNGSQFSLTMLRWTIKVFIIIYYLFDFYCFRVKEYYKRLPNMCPMKNIYVRVKISTPWSLLRIYVYNIAAQIRYECKYNWHVVSSAIIACYKV